MIPLFAWVIIGITAAMLACSALIRRRYLPPPHVAMPPPEPAPWEKDGGQDLTMPPGGPEAISIASPKARIRPAGAAGQISQALLDDVTRGLHKIPPFPQAVLQIMRELDAAGSSARGVAEILSTEPVLTATLLRIANSAMLGLNRQIVTVADAIAYLGFSTVKALLVRLKVGGMFYQKTASGRYNQEKLWVHSMAVAQVAEELARRAGGADPELALTAGLLHDIGKIAINSQFPDTVGELWKPGGAADESFLARERRLFGADHAFIGGYLATNWKLPDELTEMIRLHHLPGGPSPDLAPMPRRVLFAVFVANQLVKFSHVYCEDMEIDIIPAAIMTELGLPSETEKLLDAPMRRIIDRAMMMGADPQSPTHTSAAA